MKIFAVAVLAGILVGLIVFAACYIIGGLPHLDIVRTYAPEFGILAGAFTFAKRWDWRLPV